MAVELFKGEVESGRRKFRAVPSEWRFRWRSPSTGIVMVVSTMSYATKQDALEAAMQVFGLGAVTDMSESACR